MTRVTLGKSRMRESRTSGSVRAKAKWLSYSTVTGGGERRRRAVGTERIRGGMDKTPSDGLYSDRA